MAPRKDDSQKPPEGGGRRGVIWRLPATQRTDAPEAKPARPKDRRVRLLAVAGLAAALVCVGLYAAWSEFGSDIWGESDAPDVATAPAAAPPIAEQAGDGSTGGGAAASPPADDAGLPLVAADEGADDGEDRSADVAESETVAPAVSARQSVEAAPSQGEGTVLDTVAPDPDPDPAPPTPAVAVDDPQPTPPAAAARDEAAAPVETADAAADAPSRAQAPAQVDVGTDTPNALEERLATIATTSPAATGAETAVAALERRVSALENDPSRAPLGQALAEWTDQRATLEAALAEVSARLAHFEQEAARQAAADGHLVSLALASGELTAALSSSRRFAPVLDTLRAIVGDDPEIESALARMAPFAASGVPTIEGLLARFPEAANAIVRAAPAAENADWIDETVTRLSQLVTIRKTSGAIDPQSLDGRLVEAEAALAAGDLHRAIATVESLIPGATDAASAHAWLRDARARHEVDDALAALVDIVRARIGARWAAPVATP